MSCYDKAVELLGRRSHFRRQLEVKLEQRDYPREEIESTLERLADLGYLDDRCAAAEFCAQRLQQAPMGRRRLRAELLQRGVEAEIVAATLDHSLPEDDLEMARAAAGSRFRHRAHDRGSVARFLDRRGFSQSAILRVIAEFAADADAPLEDETLSQGR